MMAEGFLNSHMRVLKASTANITSKPSKVSLQKIKEWTTRMTLLTGHISKYKVMVNQQLGLPSLFPNICQTVSLGFQPTAKVEVIPRNRIYLADLIKTIGIPQLGKFLICRTIAWPYKQNGVHLVVEDGQDPDKAALLSLYNFVLDEVFDPLALPRGIALLIKNPWFKVTGIGGLGLRCDNPSEVQILSPTDAAVWGFFPDAEISSLFINFLMGEPQPPPTHNWRVRGNAFFGDKNFFSALRAYTEGLKVTSSEVDSIPLLTNRAMTFLNLGLPRLALKDSDEALCLDPQNIKATYRKALSLCRTNQHQVALDFLRNNSKRATFPREVKDLEKFIDKELGATPQEVSSATFWQTKWSDVLELPSGEIYLNHMEYTGPVTVAKVQGKGRGLITSSKINKGDLILVSRAFHVVTSEFRPNDSQLAYSINVSTKRASAPSQIKLVGTLANLLLLEPSRRKDWYQLTAGSNFGHIENNERPGTSTGGPEGTLLLDVQRIERICLLNAFGSTMFNNVNKERSGSEFMKNQHKNPIGFAGIWILPSYINHSCSNFNAVQLIHGDLMFIMALKEIKAGQEVYINYSSNLGTFSKKKRREKLKESYEFECKCRICK